MFFISPIKTLYSIKFYLKTLQESLWKSFGFLVYLCVIGAIFLILYTPVKFGPILSQSLDQVADIIPNITISDGIITANNNKKIAFAPKELQGQKIIFDTASEEPAYPTQMQKENILMYVNKTTVYISTNGQFQSSTVQKDFKWEVSKEILLTNKTQIIKTIQYFLMMIIVLALVFRIAILTVIALIVAFIMSAITKVNLNFKQLLTLAFYLQGPVLLLDLVLFLLPIKVIGMSVFAALIIFIVYLNLIFLNMRVTSNNKAKTLLDEDED